MDAIELLIYWQVVGAVSWLLHAVASLHCRLHFPGMRMLRVRRGSCDTSKCGSFALIFVKQTIVFHFQQLVGWQLTLVDYCISLGHTSTFAEDLPHQHAERPDVSVRRVEATLTSWLVKLLRRHPIDWDTVLFRLAAFKWLVSCSFGDHEL